MTFIKSYVIIFLNFYYMGFVSNHLLSGYFSWPVFAPRHSPPVCMQKAIAAGDVAAIRALVEKDPQLANLPLSDGELPLHAAVRLQKREVVSLLLAQGADRVLRDFQGMTALEYAAAQQDSEMLRLILPEQLVQAIDSVQQEASRFTFSDAGHIKKVKQQIEQIKGQIAKNSRNERDLRAALFFADDEKCALVLEKTQLDVNRCDKEGISPLLIAALLGRQAILQKMVARGGKLFLKNQEGVAPADLLFARGAEKDPLRLQKAQLLLTLLSVGSIMADRYLVPHLPSGASALWHGALLLLNVGTDLALTYQAYLASNPATLFDKAVHWTSAFAFLPFYATVDKIPGARVLWDVWRTCAVTKGALAQIGVAYQNFTYEKQRSLCHAALQVLTAGSVAYNCRHSFYKLKQFLFNDIPLHIKSFQDLSGQISELEKEKIRFEKEKLATEKEIVRQQEIAREAAQALQRDAELEITRQKSRIEKRSWPPKKRSSGSKK